MTDTQCLWTIADICAATNGQTHHGAADTAINGISIDSREIKAGDLFVALPGTVSDGHKFLAAAQSAGASAALVSKIDRRLDLPQICVTDCLQALRQLGMAGRARFDGIQFGITGSVGKTGSKEMLRHALSQFGSCHASQRSFNNHIGVPISLASLPQNAEFAVQEMGMNAAGEIAELTKLTRPQIALITRIADSHSAFFASTADTAAAKAEIFQAIEGLSIAVLNRDDAFYEILHAAAIAAGAKQVISFGHHPEAAYRLVSITDHDAGMTIKACLAGTDYVFELRMYGRHLAENAMGVLACVAAAGLPADKAAAALVDCQPPSGRGQRHSGIYNNCKISIIDDSYNASPASMAAAFTSLAATPPHIMVLSEMRELGAATNRAHAALAPQINKLAPRIVIAIGTAMHDMLGALDQSIMAVAATDIEGAVKELNHAITNGDRIFIKGSNGSGAWRVRDALCAAMTSDAPKRTLKGASHAA